MSNLVESLRDELRAIPMADLTTRWGVCAERLRAHMMNRDWARFRAWTIVEEVMGANSPWIDAELLFLQGLKDWPRYEAAMQEDWRGGSPPWPKYPASSGNLIHQVTHLAMFEETTHKRIDEMSTIWEFGGGYGAMCRSARRLGFAGQYVIYDLPIVSLLQRYYLEGVDVKCVTNLRDVPKAGDLFIAMWSISEVPIQLREEVKPIVAGYKAALMAYQYAFDGVENEPYFRNWPGPGEAQHWRITHMPVGSFYHVWEAAS